MSFDLSFWSIPASQDFVIAVQLAAYLQAASDKEVWATGQILGFVDQSGTVAKLSLLGV